MNYNYERQPALTEKTSVQFLHLNISKPHLTAMIAKADVSVIVSGAVDIQMVKHLIIGTILLKRLYQLWRHEVILQSDLPIQVMNHSAFVAQYLTCVPLASLVRIIYHGGYYAAERGVLHPIVRGRFLISNNLIFKG